MSASGTSSFVLIGLDDWDTSKVTNMNNMFYLAGGFTATMWSIGDLSNWNTSNVTNMSWMFYQAGFEAETWQIGDLSSWDTSKVTDMSYMFDGAGRNSTTWHSIGVLKVYATNISNMFNNAISAQATLNIYSNPTSYQNAFYLASEQNGGLITVNYSSATTNIDNIIATKSYSSNVVKGVQLD
jgi:hypothetical protein